MHISFLLSDLKGGGAQKMVINLANWFSARGHRCDIVMFSADGIYRDLISDDVQIHNFGASRTLHALKPLTRYIKEKQPDIIFSALYHVNLIAILARLISGIKSSKLAISERNHLTRYLASCSWGKHALLKFLIKALYPFSDHIIGISDGVCDDLKTILPSKTHEKIETIYNPVVTDDFKTSVEKDTPSPFPDACTAKLITSGRLVEQKDYPVLLNAFAIYLEQTPKAHLVILGDGHLRQSTEVLARDLNISSSITFAGFVDHPLSYMKHADLFVMSSAWEGFCNVIVEALYCGLHVVTTNCPSGPAEILEHGTYGSLCPVGNARSLADNISSAISNPNSKDTQKKRALNFHVDQIGQQFETRFKELAQ